MSRVALITGGSRGIGKAIAARLKQDGCRVAISYKQSAGDTAADLAVRSDIAVPGEAATMVGRVERELGPVDILVNNAGVLHRGDLFDMNLDEFEAMRKVNVDGLVAATRAAALGMKQRGWGRIINLASVAAHGTNFSGVTFYAATKAAVVALTRRFAYDLGPHGVTVNAIAPGFIMTDMVTQGKSEAEVAEIRERMSSRAIMRRVGTVEDVAHAVSYVASEGASFLTAQTITVDGGRMDYISHP